MDARLPPADAPGSPTFSQVVRSPVGALRRTTSTTSLPPSIGLDHSQPSTRKHTVSPPSSPQQPTKKKQKKAANKPTSLSPPRTTIPPALPSSDFVSSIPQSEKSSIKVLSNGDLVWIGARYAQPNEEEVKSWAKLGGQALWQRLLVSGQIQTLLFSSQKAFCKCGGKITFQKGGGPKIQKLTWDRQGWTSHWNACAKNKFKKKVEKKNAATSQGKQSKKPGDAGNIMRFMIDKKDPSFPSTSNQTASPSLLPSLTVQESPQLRACLGVQHPGVKQYASANVKAKNRGAFNPCTEEKLRRTLFPYKYADKIIDPFTPAELLKITRNRYIAPLPSDAPRSNDLALNSVEIDKLEEYRRATRRWEVKGERVYSVKCEREMVLGDVQCGACRAVYKEEGGLRSVLSRAAKQASLSTEETEINLENSKYIPHSQLIDVLTEANELKNNPILRRLQLHPPDTDLAVAEEFSRLANDGSFKDKQFVIDLISTMIEVTKREGDETGNAMKGIRYKQSILEFLVLLRGVGAGSLQRMGLLRGAGLGVPSDRTMYATMASYNALKLSEPGLCLKNVELVAERLKELGYDGPLALATDCTKVEPKLQFSNSHAPRDPENPNRKIGGHLFGSLLDWSECYMEKYGELHELLDKVATEGLLATSIRLTLLVVPLPNMPPFPIAMEVVPKTEKAEDIAAHLTKARRLMSEAGLHCISLNSDAAAVEIKAKTISLADGTFSHDSPITYHHPTLGLKITVEVRDGLAIFLNLDVEHSRKSVRNAELSGNRSLTVGSADKQDDGAARRVFSAQALETCTVDGKGEEVREEMTGFFVLSFVLGSLNPYLLIDTLLTQRIRIASRAFFFLLIWKDWILKSTQRTALLGLAIPFLTLEANFISSQTFNTQISLINGIFALILIHREHFPNVPLLPDTHSTKACEHEFGNARQSIPNFTHLEFIRTQQHSQTRRTIIASGRVIISVNQKSRMGYTDGMTKKEQQMSEEDFERAKTFPTNERIDLEVLEGSREAVALAAFVGMGSKLPTKARIEELLKGTTGDVNFDPNEDYFELHRNEASSSPPNSSDPATFTQEAANSAAQCLQRSTQAVDELEQLATQAFTQPPTSTPLSLAHLLNPSPPEPIESSAPSLTILKDGKLCVARCVAVRKITDFHPTVASQRNRKTVEKGPSTTSLSQNAASAIIKSEALDNSLLRKDSPHWNARMQRWQGQVKKGAAIVKQVKLPGFDQFLIEKSGPVLAEAKVPLIETRGVSQLCPITIDSIVAFAFPLTAGGSGIFLGRVIGLFQNGSGRHDCIPSSTNLSELSFVTCEIWAKDPESELYEDFQGGLNEFHHKPGFFIHTSPDKILYTLYGATLKVTSVQGLHKKGQLNVGVNGWARYKAIVQQEDQLAEAREAAAAAVKAEKEKKAAEAKKKREEKKQKKALEAATTWIDLNLPPPPNVASLTGYVALPPSSILDSDPTTPTAQVLEPELNHLETSDLTSVVGKGSKACLIFETDKDYETSAGMNDNGYVPVYHSKEISPAISSPPSPPLCSSSSKSVSPVESLPLVSSNSSRSTEEVSNPSAAARKDHSGSSSSTATDPIRSGPRKTSSLARLHLGRLPLDTRPSEVKELFDDIGVVSRIIRSHNKKDWGFCFVDVQSDEVTYCIRKLNCAKFGDFPITCSLAVGVPHYPEPPSKRSRPPSPSSRPSHDHQFAPTRRPSPPQVSQSHSLPPPLSTNLLVLDLPPHDTDQSTQFLLNLPTHTILDFTSKGQTVVFIKVDSEEMADRITSLWNRCVVSGRIIKVQVVRAKRGLEAEEAALAYFEEQEGPSYCRRIRAEEEKIPVIHPEQAASEKGNFETSVLYVCTEW
ncbi:hypothetical protein JCM5353_007350 [Sporobolomyces roseus]